MRERRAGKWRGERWGRVIAGVLLAMSALAASGESVGAQATRTWVSGVGDDVNPCSRTAPCKTFAGAQSKTATGGEINVLDSGSFGAITITKPLTIDASGLNAVVTAGAGLTGIRVLLAPASAATGIVVLRGLTIETSDAARGTVGISFEAGLALFVEETTVDGFAEHGIMTGPAATSELYVTRSSISNNGGAGIRATTSGQARVTVTDSQLVNNGVGLDARSNARVAVIGSTASGNAGAGFQAQPDAGAAELTVESSTSAANGVGVLAGGGATVRLSNAFVTQNGTGVQVAGGSPAGSIVSFGNNQIYGNTTDGAVTATVPQQ